SSERPRAQPVGDQAGAGQRRVWSGVAPPEHSGGRPSRSRGGTARYAQVPGVQVFTPAGERGWGNRNPSRFWGLNPQESYAASKEFGVPCATGATADDVAMRLEQGFRIIMTSPVRSTPGLVEGRRLAAR